MKQVFFLFLLSIVTKIGLQAQQYDCNFKSPVIAIDFGDDRNPQNFLLTQLKDNYRYAKNICPDNGQFTFSSYTNNCFNDNWVSFYKDHTPGSVKGRMMIVNAAEKPATFFSVTLSALKPNTMYELSTWFVNICPGTVGCEPLPPQIRITVIADGKLLSVFYTGVINATGSDTWSKYAGKFKTPATFSGILVAMSNVSTSGCGNDFAMDDIEIRECRFIPPVQPPVTKPQAVVVTKPPVKITVPKPAVKPVTKIPAPSPKVNTSEVKAERKETVVKPAPLTKPIINPVTPLPLPAVIKERSNPVVKEIQTTESEITVELYDNGEIDGDTVTIYHNNKMLVSHAGLSTKPVTVTIKVDKDNPHHELVMVANNLGSIPPNTSLMVITTKHKRYEVFISSSEQKNAKVVIDLEQ